MRINIQEVTYSLAYISNRWLACIFLVPDLKCPPAFQALPLTSTLPERFNPSCLLAIRTSGHYSDVWSDIFEALGFGFSSLLAVALSRADDRCDAHASHSSAIGINSIEKSVVFAFDRVCAGRRRVGRRLLRTWIDKWVEGGFRLSVFLWCLVGGFEFAVKMLDQVCTVKTLISCVHVHGSQGMGCRRVNPFRTTMRQSGLRRNGIGRTISHAHPVKTAKHTFARFIRRVCGRNGAYPYSLPHQDKFAQRRIHKRSAASSQKSKIRPEHNFQTPFL